MRLMLALRERIDEIMQTSTVFIYASFEFIKKMPLLSCPASPRSTLPGPVLYMNQKSNYFRRRQTRSALSFAGLSSSTSNEP